MATIDRGRILAYRVFDTGDTIALDVVERLLGAAKRVDMGGPLVEGLVIPVRPLEVELGTCTIRIPQLDREVEATASAHVFDFGAVSILYDIPITPATPIVSLVPLCDALYDAVELDTRG